MELLNIFANCFSSIKQNDYLQGWTESIARAIVASLETFITQGRKIIGSVLGEFINKAVEATHFNFDFPRDHPYFTAGFATIVTVVFESLWANSNANSFAAWWQSTYAGFVPKGSLFSFFQRLGMIWGRS
ncbi:hypothetical protein M9X92_012217 [Pyricularia oryzae]|nr:hypothetical protein M9X92_012217 [Pyricularia oryzae]